MLSCGASQVFVISLRVFPGHILVDFDWWDNPSLSPVPIFPLPPLPFLTLLLSTSLPFPFPSSSLLLLFPSP